MNKQKIIKVDHLIVSSSIDYATDYISLELKRRGESFLRINRDQFRDYELFYSFGDDALYITISNHQYRLDKRALRSVYFRAPVFIRTNKPYGVEEQLYRSQWSSFIRNLIVFENARWINHPVSTYRAENKLYQLDKARESGLCIPETIIGNCLGDFCTDSTVADDAQTDLQKRFVIKSLDTALFYNDKEEWFTYSTLLSDGELKKSSITDAPVIIQECLQNKIDIRVTIIGDNLFSASITKNDAGIEGDWRRTSKEELQYKPIVLPDNVIACIRKLMQSLNLVFGGMDLAFSKGKYYFIEVNPTGEWAWLVNTAGFKIPKAIVDYMIGKYE